MTFRAALLTAWCAGSLLACAEFASTQATADEAVQPLQLVITAEKSSYQASDIPTTQYPSNTEAVISVTGAIQNISQQDQWFYAVQSTGVPTYHLTGPTGQPVEIASVIADPPLPRKEDFVLIKVGESLAKRFDVHFWIGETVTPGIYTLSMTYKVWMNWYLDHDNDKVARVEMDAWTGTLHSNEVKIEIR